ncbi:hypothetical protein [Rhizobium sp. RU36D]|uniref:hypothetical protein n=1 Tax=Rhizobium sp. RU36D TaxID=1907415 RepID=UPI0009D7C2CB|nr:hypothetical protein [Rhizobium sp. RU36D]SMD16358.1 hypothetical protein SAMN05880593_12958 [Rhizobium sp. RU36D]
MNRAHTLIQLGGTQPITDDNKAGVNAVLHSTKNKGASYLLHFDGLKARCGVVESTLRKLGFPEFYWDGVEFSTYSDGPGRRYPFDTVVGVWARVRRIEGKWHLVDAEKCAISKTEDGEPRFLPFTAEQWEQIPEPDDNPYRRVNIRFTK